jgi:hypothetical protein
MKKYARNVGFGLYIAANVAIGIGLGIAATGFCEAKEAEKEAQALLVHTQHLSAARTRLKNAHGKIDLDSLCAAYEQLYGPVNPCKEEYLAKLSTENLSSLGTYSVK